MRSATQHLLLAAVLAPGAAGCSLIESEAPKEDTARPLLCDPGEEPSTCPQGRQFCHPDIKICVDYGCVGDPDCAVDQKCDLTYYRCVEKTCAVDTDCDDGRYCDPITLQCKAGCRPESCREEQYCYKGSTPRECRARGCANDGECKDQEYCLLEPVQPAQYDEPVDGEGDRVRVVVGSCRFGCRTGETDACQRGEFCDGLSRRCGPLSCAEGVEACAPMAAVGPDPRCDPDLEVCDQPVYCDPDSLKCRYGCIGEMWEEADPAPCADIEAQYCSIESPRRRCRPRTCTRDVDCTRFDMFCDVARGGGGVGTCRAGCRPGHCRNPLTDKCDVLTRKCEFTGCDANADCDDCLDTGECVGVAPHYCDTLARQCRQGCRDSTDCAAGRTCDPRTRACVGDPCPNGNADCLPGEYCAGDFGGKRCEPGCRLDDASSCPSLQPCRPSDHECGCDANPAVCPDGRRCLRNSCVVPCDTDADCRALGLVCDDGVGQCTEGCADDELEDRGAVFSLDELSEEDSALIEAGLAICDNDTDWYAFTLAVGQSVTARIDFDHPLSNLDLFLFGPGDDVDGDLEAHCAPRADGLRRCSRGRAGHEEIRMHTAPEAGQWALAVRRFDPRADIEAAPRAPYLLAVTLGDPPGECVEDDLEEGALGSNDERETASLIEPSEWDDLRLCGSGVDWYVVSLAESDVMTATLRFDHARSDLDLAVFAPFEEFPDAILTSECDHLSCVDPDVEEVILGPIPEQHGGLYDLRVQTKRPGVPATYSMDVAVDRVGAGCVSNDDGVEPNGGRQTATRVGVGAVVGGLCPALDEDWYAVEVPAKGSVRATLAYESDRGFPRFDLRLVTAEGFPLRTDAGAHSDKVVAAGGDPAPALYYAQVLPGTASSVGPYEITFEVALPPPCEDDDREDNDNLGQASPIQPGQALPRQLCPWDEDWFELSVGSLDDVSLALVYAPDVSFRVQLMDGDGEPVGGCVDRLGAEAPVALEDCTSAEGAGSERLEVADLAAGDYAIRVWGADDGFSSDVGRYTLDVDVIEEPCDRDDPGLEHDAYEEDGGNDTRARAATLAAGLHNDLTLCRADEDWFHVDVPPDRELRLLLTFDEDDGDLEMSLHGGDGAVLQTCGGGASACVAVADAAADLLYHRDAGGLDVPVWVRVYGGQPGDPNHYAMTIEINEIVEDGGDEGAGEGEEEGDAQ